MGQAQIPTDKWVLKPTVSTLWLLGGKKLRFDQDYKVIAVHLQCNLIFFVFGWDNTLMAYEMDRREVRIIRNLGHDSWGSYLPYVPFFSESLADEHWNWHPKCSSTVFATAIPYQCVKEYMLLSISISSSNSNQSVSSVDFLFKLWCIVVLFVLFLARPLLSNYWSFHTASMKGLPYSFS